ncbi:MAG: IS630 family transposase [Chitinophagales bacterium]
MQNKRDESLFRFFEKEVQLLKQEAIKEDIDLVYFDGCGFDMNPSVPYCWSKKGETVLLPALRSKGYTVLGLLNIYKNEFYGNIYQGSANAQCVIQTLDDYAHKIQKKTIIILDNASIHKAKIVQEKMKQWRHKGMYLQFIPAYSPELNLIEILWKMIKHFWLQPKHYCSMDSLHESIINILQNYGNHYAISFG